MDTEEEKENTDAEPVLGEVMPETEMLEFEYNDDGAADLKKTLKKFRADLKECKKKAEEYLTGWQKERAEFANFRMEEEKRKIRIAGLAKEKTLLDFASVLDSFDMAFANKEAWQKVDKNWRMGVEHIHSQLLSAFEKNGAVSIGKSGETFDPMMHHSVGTVETNEEKNDHMVAEVLQNGYKLGESILRPAKVQLFAFKA